MRLNWSLVALTLALVALPVLADTPKATPPPAATPSPRQAYQQAMTLYAQGHAFTSDEQDQLRALKGKLIETGDSDLAANLDLLRIGSSAEATRSQTQQEATTTLLENTDEWNDRVHHLEDARLWRVVRDTALTTFTVSMLATLLLATVNDQDQAYLHNGQFNDSDPKRTFSNGMSWALVGSAGTMLVSLFPLLWGQAHQ